MELVPILTKEQVANFHRDGYVVAESLIPRELVEAARASLVKLMFEGGDGYQLNWTAELGHHDSQVGRVRPINHTDRRPVMTQEAFKVVCWPSIYWGASQLLGEKDLKLFLSDIMFSFRYVPKDKKEIPQRVHVDCKIPDSFEGWPKGIGCFHYFTDVVENGGAFSVIPGGQNRVMDEVEREPDEEHQYSDRPEWHNACVPIPAPAGSVVYFHPLMPHRVSYNYLPQARLATVTNFWIKSAAPPPSYNHGLLNETWLAELSPEYRDLLGLPLPAS